MKKINLVLGILLSFCVIVCENVKMPTTVGILTFMSRKNYAQMS